MRSFWVDFPLNTEQYSKLNLKWRRRQNFYEIRNPQPELRIRNFCTFGGDDYKVISLEAREHLTIKSKLFCFKTGVAFLLLPNVIYAVTFRNVKIAMSV